MLKIDRDNQNFSLLDSPTLSDVSITERYDLQEYICNSPVVFAKEIGQELFLIGNEVLPSKTVQDRIDILALDKEGSCVIIELKRGNHKLHMFQAISYARMISQWSSDDILNLLDEGGQEELVEFLEVDKDDINRQQRIILVAEAYDHSLLIGAEWLSERFGVDISCCRIAIAKDNATNSEYLVCSNIYPAPELASEAVARGRKGTSTTKEKWSTWEQALENISNEDLVLFFKQELEIGREAYLRKRILRYRIGAKRRWFLAARKVRCYVWQHSRFGGDVDFWRNELSHPDEVKEVKNGECLRMFLYTANDFSSFRDAATKKLTAKEWLEGSSDEELEET